MVGLIIAGLVSLAIGIALFFRLDDFAGRATAVAAAAVGVLMLGYGLAGPVAGFLEHGL